MKGNIIRYMKDVIQYEIPNAETIASMDEVKELKKNPDKDHSLAGNFIGCRECHITLAWLLIYEISEGELILFLTRTGTHSDLF